MLLLVGFGLTVATAPAQSINVTATGVGIGTATPTVKLEVSQHGALKIGQAYLSSGGDFAHLANNEWFDGTIWRTTNTPGVLLQLSAQDTTIFTHDGNGQHTSRFRIQGYNGYVGIGTNAPNSRIEMYGDSGQYTGALEDAGTRDANLALNVNSVNYGCGAAITFGNWQSKQAGSIGFASIKSFLTDGADRTKGDLTFSTRNITSDTALTERMRITSAGNVGIGTLTPTYKLTVNGQVKSRGYITDISAWSDYVFAPDYKLPSLNEVEAHIKSKGHLPDVPSESELVSNGLDLGKMSATQMAQIEQLMLHVIALNKKVQAQAEEIQTQAEQVSYQAEEIRKLKSQAGRN